MDEVFKEGEIGILQNLPGPAAFFNGEEVEVVGGLDQRHVLTMNGNIKLLVSYIIAYRGLKVAVRPSNLRRPRKPIITHAKDRVTEVV